MPHLLIESKKRTATSESASDYDILLSDQVNCTDISLIYSDFSMDSIYNITEKNNKMYIDTQLITINPGKYTSINALYVYMPIGYHITYNAIIKRTIITSEDMDEVEVNFDVPNSCHNVLGYKKAKYMVSQTDELISEYEPNLDITKYIKLWLGQGISDGTNIVGKDLGAAFAIIPTNETVYSQFIQSARFTCHRPETSKIRFNSVRVRITDDTDSIVDFHGKDHIMMFKFD